MKKSLISLGLVFVLLAACHSATPIATPTLVVTITPTVLPSPTPTLTPTKIPTYTPPPPKPTLSLLEIAGEILTGLSIDETHAYSANGMCEWKRILAWPNTETSQLKYNNQFFTYVTATCGNLNAPWVLVKNWSPAEIGYAIPDLLGWSSDGKLMYFYDSHIPDGCQPPGGFQSDLRQVDLSDGIIRLLPISWTGGMALSPDTRRVIYYDRTSAMVGIYELISGVELRYPFELPAGLESWFAGDFTWSPDSQSALFIIQYGDACFPTGVSLRRVDMEKNKPLGRDNVYALLEVENKSLSIVEWKEASRVLISIEGKNVWLDPISGNVSPIYNPP